MPDNDREQLLIRTDDQKTIDLCGHEHPRARCIRHRGHDGPHEAIDVTASEPLRWD
jgi:hypothetical protein